MTIKKISFFNIILILILMCSTICFAEEIWHDFDAWGEDQWKEWQLAPGASGAISGAGTFHTITQNGVEVEIYIPAGGAYGGLTGNDGTGLNWGPGYDTSGAGDYDETLDMITDTLNAIMNDPSQSDEQRKNAATILEGLDNEQNTFWKAEAAMTQGGETHTAREWEQIYNEVLGEDWKEKYPEGSADKNSLAFGAEALINLLNSLTDENEKRSDIKRIRFVWNNV